MPNSTDDEIYLSDLSSRDKPWDEHKANAVKVQTLFEDLEYQRYVERMQKCAKQLDFAFQAQDTGELKLKLQHAWFCRVRFCPTCQWRRTLMWRARFYEMLPRLLSAYPSARFIFLTPTVKNCPLGELRDTIALMTSAWQRLSQRKAFPAIGWVRSLEVTRNPDDNSAHPHFHCLLMVKPSYFTGKHYIKQSEWRELWRDALRVDYLPVVNVKVVKPPKHLEGDDRAGLATAIMETLKYGVKEPDLLASAEWLAGLTKQLHNVRGVAVGGELKRYLRDDEPEDLINTDDPDPDWELLDNDDHIIFEWKSIISRYAKKN